MLLTALRQKTSMSVMLMGVLILIGAASPAYAQSQTTDIRPDAKRLKGDDLLGAFTGQTFDGAYNFTDKGEPRRFFKEIHQNDNKAVYTEKEQTTQGIWMILRDAICYRYKSDVMTGGCFRVYKIGNCYYFYDQRRPENSLEIGENYWTARSTRKGEVADCDPNFT